MRKLLNRMSSALLLAALLALIALPGCGSPPKADTTSPADAGPNAIDPIANRSAFPEPGETLDKPIAAKRLSDEDQFAPQIDPADIPAVVPWEQASQYVGYEITVEGRIVTVGRSNDGNVHFLNFAEDYRDKFYMVIFDDLAQTLDKPVEELFKGKLVRVKAEVETYRGKPQIRIRSMDEVVYLEP